MASSCAKPAEAGATSAAELDAEAAAREAWCEQSVEEHRGALRLARWRRQESGQVQPLLEELWERYAAAARRAGAAHAEVPGSVVARRADLEARAAWARWAERQLPVDAEQLVE